MCTVLAVHKAELTVSEIPGSFLTAPDPRADISEYERWYYNFGQNRKLSFIFELKRCFGIQLQDRVKYLMAKTFI